MFKCRTIPSILNQTGGALVLPLRFPLRGGKSPQLPAAAKDADNATGGLITEVVKRGDFAAKAGEVCVLHLGDGKGESKGKGGKGKGAAFGFARIILAGLGEHSADGASGEDDGLTAALAAAAKLTDKVAIAMPLMPDDDGGESLMMRAVLAAGAAAYQFNLGGHFPQKMKFDDVAFVAPAAHNKAAQKILTFARAAAFGAMMARHLAEQPGNVCDPPFLASVARAIGKQYNLRANILNPPQLAKLKMNALLAVAAGSRKPAHLITLHYQGAGAGKKNIALVGKGVTFDTGGISLKPAAAMDEMKFDMGGAASVLGAICAVAMLKMPLNVVAVVPTCENMPGGNATKPGDVITAMNGKTIEVLNTDAEGRLILADALTYTQRQFAPAVIVDAATLTGACVIALGHHTSGMVSDSDDLAAALTSAGDEIGDVCWRLPIGARYQAQLKSDYADIANIGGRPAGTLTAACFLSRFIDGGKNKAEWAHLDIAGTAWTTKKRATGRPVPLFLNYLRRLG